MLTLLDISSKISYYNANTALLINNLLTNCCQFPFRYYTERLFYFQSHRRKPDEIRYMARMSVTILDGVGQPTVAVCSL